MKRQLTALIAKEVRLEWKQRYALGGILLYVIATVFIVYLSFRQVIDLPTWNALFWIIQVLPRSMPLQRVSCRNRAGVCSTITRWPIHERSSFPRRFTTSD